MDFESFEGIKRIKNEKQLTAEKLVDILDEYEKILGDISYRMGLDNANIIVDFKGKYNTEIRVDSSTDEIIIERKLDEGYIEVDDPQIQKDDDLSVVNANRLIEQIYDLIKDYIDDGVITEHITESKKTLHMSEEEKVLLGGVISGGNVFKVVDDNNKLLYEINEKPLIHTYCLKNIETNREEIVIDYSGFKKHQYSMTVQPFENFVFNKDTSNVKTVFLSKTNSKEIKISGDYTDNHYLIELNEVVIGTVDCLDPYSKLQYKLGIHNLEMQSMIVAIAVMLDTFIRKEKIENIE